MQTRVGWVVGTTGRYLIVSSHARLFSRDFSDYILFTVQSRFKILVALKLTDSILRINSFMMLSELDYTQHEILSDSHLM